MFWQREKSRAPLAGFEPRIVQPIANRCTTGYAIPPVVTLVVIYVKCRHVLLAFTDIPRFLLFSSIFFMVLSFSLSNCKTQVEVTSLAHRWHLNWQAYNGGAPSCLETRHASEQPMSSVQQEFESLVEFLILFCK
jgi:hypothetical protein